MNRRLRPAHVIWPLALAAALLPLNSTMGAVALTPIAHDLNVSLAAVSWLVSVYLVAMAVAQPVGGRLGDHLGHQRMTRLGLMGFLVASLLAASAPTLTVLVAARTAQALAAGLVLPNSLARVHASSPGRLGRRVGALAAIMTLAAAAGPALGAWLLATAGWRAIFLINLPLVMIALFADRQTPAMSVQRRPSASYALHPLSSPIPWRSPARRRFNTALTGIAATNLVLYTLLIAIPVLLADRGWRPASAALALCALSLASLVAAPVGGWLADTRGAHTPALLGGALMAVALVPLAVQPTTITATALALSLVLAGLGIGLTSPALQTSALETTDPAHAGTVAGLATTARYLGSIVAAGGLSLMLAISENPMHGLGLIFAVVLTINACATVATHRSPRTPDETRPDPTSAMGNRHSKDVTGLA